MCVESGFFKTIIIYTYFTSISHKVFVKELYVPDFLKKIIT